MQLCDFIVTSRLTNCLLHEMEMSYKNKKNSHPTLGGQACEACSWLPILGPTFFSYLVLLLIVIIVSPPHCLQCFHLALIYRGKSRKI